MSVGVSRNTADQQTGTARVAAVAVRHGFLARHSSRTSSSSRTRTPKRALVEAGAEEWSIYTKAELRVIVAQNRVAPLSAGELKQLHQIKRTFNARIK